MILNYNVEQYECKNSYRNLMKFSNGVVKCQKFFPVYLNNGIEEIFKPLDKTKPFSSPFFAYSEVFWSTVINTYFDSQAPIYRLAICKGYSEYLPGFHDKGIIVSTVLQEGEELVNLLEYFKQNNDPNVDINNYINYCMIDYDYTPIFDSKIFKENIEFGRQLALQILLSILKADQNYHYENVSFIFKEGKPIRLAPPIDHEFSTMFMFVDDIEVNKKILSNYRCAILTGDTLTEQVIIQLLKNKCKTMKNLNLIVDRYEDVVTEFLKSLEFLICDLEKNRYIFEDNEYLFSFNSNNHLADKQIYENNNSEKAQEILSGLQQREINIEEASKLIQEEVLLIAKTLQKNLTQRLEIKHQKTKNFTI